MKRHFECWLQGFMDYSQNVDVPERYLLWSAISVIAGALERKVWATNLQVTWYPNFYIMLVGSAGSRKSTTTSRAMDLLGAVPGITFISDEINKASLFEKLQLAGQSKPFEWHNETYQNSSVFLYASEAATSFAEMYVGGGIIITLTDLFNCGLSGWHQHRGYGKHTKKDGECLVYNPCINLLGCTTEAWLSSKVISKEDAEGGFGSRLLLVVHRGAFRKSYEWVEDAGEQVGMRLKLIEDLRHIATLKGPFRFSPSFKSRYSHYDQLHGEWLLERVALGFQERKLTYAMKLAMVLAVSRSDVLELRAEHLDESWELLCSIEPEMLEAFGNIKTTKIEITNSKRVMQWCLDSRRMKFTKLEACQAFQDELTMKELSQALLDLVQAGRLAFDMLNSHNGNIIYAVMPQTPGLELVASEPAQSR